MNNNEKMKIIRNIMLLTIIFILIILGINIYEDSLIKEKGQNTLNNEAIQQLAQENKNVKKEENKKYKKVKIANEYKGYKVSASWKIDKLDIDTYVLEQYSKPAMEVSVAKYFGPSPNEEGNYCIAGHNYITKNMFSKLGNLNIGDKLFLTDNFHGNVCYVIYDKYKVKPTQVSSLSQKTNGRKEITLITCSDYSSKRIIIKAREKLESES